MPSFEDLDDEEQDEEGDEEEEIEEAEARAAEGIGGVGAMPPMIASVKKQRKHNPASSHKGKKIAPRGRIPVSATRPSQADLLWADILQRDEITSRGIMGEHFSVRVSRLDAGQPIYLGSLDGARCVGDGSGDSAADSLVRILTDEIHWHTSRGLPATYELAFAFKHGGGFYDKGKIRLAATQEIAQMRNAESGMRMGTGAAPYAPPPQYPSGYGQPPQPPPPYQPPPQYPTGPQGYAPQGSQGFGAPPHGSSDEVSALREQLAALTDLVRDMWRNQPNGVGAVPPPQIMQQPPQLPLSALNDLARALAPLGLAINPIRPQLPAAPQVSAHQVSTGLGDLRVLAGQVKELRGVAQAIQDAFAPVTTGEPAVAEEDKIAPDFELVDVPGSKWPDGSQMRYARDDDGINWFGTALGNGYAMDKFGATLAGIGKKIVRQIGQQQGVGALGDDPEEEEEEYEEEEPRSAPAAKPNGAVRDDGFSL